MAGPTAQDLVRELAARMGEYVLLPSVTGTTTSLTSSVLGQYWTTTMGSTDAPVGAWVYGTSTAVHADNRGVERRVRSYSPTTTTATFTTAWPGTISSGAYEVHARTPRARKLAAINSAVRLLGFFWARHLVYAEAPLITAANTWTYNLPTANIQSITRVELQVNTAAGFTGYPYVDASPWNWAAVPITDASGNTSIRLQFGALPPPGRIIRLVAEIGYSDLVLDADILPLDAASYGPASEFIYSWATLQLQRWETLRQPPAQAAWIENKMANLMKEAADLRDRFQRTPPATRIVLPGVGDGQFNAYSEDPRYLAAFRTLH